MSIRALSRCGAFPRSVRREIVVREIDWPCRDHLSWRDSQSSIRGNKIAEYDATSVATIHAALVSHLSDPQGIAILLTEPSLLVMLLIGGAALLSLGAGDRLLVTSEPATIRTPMA
jgi:hypothetical protein